MGSLLDIHQYSKEAFRHLYTKLNDKAFNRPYIIRDDPIASVTGVLWDITQGDEELKKIVEGMDKIDKIRANRSQSRLEKITITWLKKAYRKHLESGYNISGKAYLNFIKSVMKPSTKEGEEKLRASGKRLFDRIYSAYRMRQASVKNTTKLDELKAKYPNLNIEVAYRYAVLTGKFGLNADDIEDFDCLVQLLIAKQ